tara:strand:+ start:84 stop:353 length:270 start_codon:yes stop_codon:yes gene_type:complete
MLRKSWPGNFRRTLTTKGRGGKESKRTLEFVPGVAVDLTSDEVLALMPDIGVALLPIELDEKARPRIIEDAVAVDQSEVVRDATQHADK